VAWKCDVCGDNIHLKKIDGKNYPIRCPLEKYKNVKTYYTSELRQMLHYTFFDDFPLSNNSSDLKKFSEMIPDSTPISKYVKKIQDVESKEYNLYTKTLVIQGSIETFFTHFTKVLIDIYDDNKIHYIDSPLLSEKEQFNYLWLSPTTMKDCWFREGRKDSRFKSMTELGNPSLVIYPIGNVSAQSNAAWGNILLELITHRQSMGKPTWIVKTKDYNQCLEIKTSDELRTFLTRSSSIPTIALESDDELLINNNYSYSSGSGGSTGVGGTSSGSYNL
jgi:hypothetical protein